MLAKCLLATLFGALVTFGVKPAAAQADYPNRPIRLVVGYGPGAVNDLVARFVAEHVGSLLGHRMIVENRPGANTALATRLVLNEKPDGYTLLFNSLTLAYNLHAFKEPGYKLDDFVTIGAYGYSGYTLFVNTKKSGANTVEDFITYGRKHPGELTVGSTGVGSATSLVSSRFDSMTKIGWREIPFKSANDAVQAVVAGTIDAFVASPSTALASMNSPDIKVFAVSGDIRSPVLPNVPTYAEIGYPINDSISLGVFAHKNTPPEIVEKLRKAMEDAKKSDQNRAALEKAGVQLYRGDWRHFNDRLKTDGDIFLADMKRLGLQPE